MLDPSRVRGIVFDLDGTLQDSKIDYQMMTDRVREILLDEGVPRDSLGDRRDVYLVIRGGGNSLLKLGVREDRVQSVLNLMSKAINKTELEATDGVKLKPNALQTLEILNRSGIRMGITTRSHRVYAEKCLSKLGIRRYFLGVLARDDVPYPKPDPRHLFDTISLLNLDPAYVLYVGDTTTDLETARAAKVDFIGYKRDEMWGQRLLEAGCETIIDDLQDVVEIALK